MAVFRVEGIIIVTQDFHLERAVYIARSLGLNSYGYKADRRSYQKIDDYILREKFADVKAFFDVLIKRNPKYLSKPIPISSDGRLSWD